MSSRTAAKNAARTRVAEMRAARVRAERRRRVLLAGAAIVAVVAVVAALVITKAVRVGSRSSTTTTASSRASAVVVHDVTSIPAATLDTVGAGTAQNAPRRIDAPALTADGKPKVLYVGAEYCPFCAAERWPLIVALSRFGTWSNLGATESAGNDVYPNTPTLSFHGASYTSDYVTFTGVETRGNTVENGQYAPLDQLSPEDEKVFEAYDRTPYTASQPGSIPFLDIAGRYVSAGASYGPEMLSGKTREQIVAALKNPGDPIAKAVDGSANVVTAAICNAIGGKPTTVCASPGVKAAGAKLTKAG